MINSLLDFNPDNGTYDDSGVLVSLRNGGTVPIPFNVSRPATAALTEGFLRKSVKGNPSWSLNCLSSPSVSLGFDLRPSIGQAQDANPGNTALMNELWGGDRGVTTFCVATESDQRAERNLYSGWPQSAGFVFPLSGFASNARKRISGICIPASVGGDLIFDHAVNPAGTVFIVSGSFGLDFSGGTVFLTAEGEYSNEHGQSVFASNARTFLLSTIDRPTGLMIANNFGANFPVNAYTGLFLRLLVTPWIDRAQRLKTVEHLKQMYF